MIRRRGTPLTGCGCGMRGRRLRAKRVRAQEGAACLPPAGRRVEALAPVGLSPSSRLLRSPPPCGLPVIFAVGVGGDRRTPRRTARCPENAHVRRAIGSGLEGGRTEATSAARLSATRALGGPSRVCGAATGGGSAIPQPPDAVRASFDLETPPPPCIVASERVGNDQPCG